MSFKNEEQKSPSKRFLFVLGLVMFTLYFVLGLTVIFWKDFPMDLPMGYRIAFGVLLIVYSFIRFVRLLRN
jgi:uncharacterized membrane protein (DUF485 family)